MSLFQSPPIYAEKKLFTPPHPSCLFLYKVQGGGEGWEQPPLEEGGEFREAFAIQGLQVSVRPLAEGEGAFAVAGGLGEVALEEGLTGEVCFPFRLFVAVDGFVEEGGGGGVFHTLSLYWRGGWKSRLGEGGVEPLS